MKIIAETALKSRNIARFNFLVTYHENSPQSILNHKIRIFKIHLAKAKLQ
jgi:hypothetical protein